MLPESSSVTYRPDLAAQVQEYDTEKAATKFIGRAAAPVFESAVVSGGYPIMRRGNFKKPTETRRESGGAYNRITGKFGKGTFDCEEHGLEHPIDDRERAKYRNLFDAEKAGTSLLWYQILMAHERRVAALYSGAGFSNTNVATAWSTTASAVPLDDLETGIETLEDSCGVNKSDISLIIPRADFREMLRTAQVIDKGKYTYPGLQPAQLSALQIASMLGIKQVLPARSAYDTTEENIAESISQIWTAGVMYLAVLADDNDPLETPSAARTIIFVEDAPELPIVESYREDKKRSDIVRVRCDCDEVLLGDDADLFAYKLTNT